MLPLVSTSNRTDILRSLEQRSKSFRRLPALLIRSTESTRLNSGRMISTDRSSGSKVCVYRGKTKPRALF